MLTGRVARLYYEHGLTHQEIADALGLSRIRVTRLLAEARTSGIVEITVRADDAFFADEERELVSRFGLKQAWVAPNIADVEKSDRSFATVGGEAVSNLIEHDPVVAVGLSRAVALVAAHFPARPRGGSYVPLGGSSAGLTNGSNPHEIALRFASLTGGKAFHLPAPLIAASPEAATLAAADPGVKKALDMAASADLLVAGIGSVSVSDQAGLLFSSLSAGQQEGLRARKTVGDVAARFFDRDGETVSGALDDCIVGLSLSQIRAIPKRVGIARGADKLEAINVAVRTGLVNMLVTDIDTARGLLSSGPAV